MNKRNTRRPLAKLTRDAGHKKEQTRPEGRAMEFASIKRALAPVVRLSSPKAILAAGDALHLLPCLPDQSVSLILTDPPYHSTKKRNIFADTAFAEDQQYLDWMAKCAHEWRRILRPNGCLFCFCAPEMAGRLEIMFRAEFNILAQIVWTKPNDPGFDGWKQKTKKEALRQWFPHSERIIFAEPACEGNLHRSYFGSLLRRTREAAQITGKQLTELIGAYGRINHGGAVSNWEAGRNIPSVEQYARLCRALLASGKVGSMPAYEDAIRPFAVDKAAEFTDIWTFPSVRPYKGKHPAEKPIALLKHAITSTTYVGDIVLDCFAGSGTTILAAAALNRLAVGIEIEPSWVRTIAARLELDSEPMEGEECHGKASAMDRPDSEQSTLFSEHG